MREARRSINIAQKLEVVKFFDDLKSKKEAAKKQLLEPRPSNLSGKELAGWRKQRKETRQTAKMSVTNLCRQKFPEVIGKSQVYKWSRAAKKECWEQIPETTRNKIVATTNQWRSKIGIDLKGKQLGGRVPLCLQKELDLLVSEMTSGRSVITERREIVTIEDIVLCWHWFWDVGSRQHGPTTPQLKLLYSLCANVVC